MLSETSRDKAAGAAERTRASFAKAARRSTVAGLRAVSIGLVHSQEAALNVPESLAQADQALYIVKERGRNRVEVASLETMLKRKDEADAAAAAASAEALAAKSAA